jgi:hypothetical protein
MLCGLQILWNVKRQNGGWIKSVCISTYEIWMEIDIQRRGFFFENSVCNLIIISMMMV